MDKIEQQIEKLAIAVAKGFDELRTYIDARFDEQRASMEARFDAIDKRFEAVETRLGNLEHKVSGLREDVLDARLAIEQLEKMSLSLSEQKELRARLLRVEDHLGLPHELPPEPAR